MSSTHACIGTAGWNLPRHHRHHFPVEGSHLERYAARFDAVEINSTFHRPHRPSTYARWAASVPPSFRFSVKLPKAITHGHRLSGARELVDAFREEVAPLGERFGCLLVQLPPSLELGMRTAERFFACLRKRFDGAIAVEPRHASWFTAQAQRLLVDHRISRVVADRLDALGRAGIPCWCIFDNTVLGAATADALATLERLRQRRATS